MTAPEEKIVRIHSSSGTTGLPVIIPYTQKDVDDWAVMFKRCYEMAGMTNMDRIQITPGYGLWTAGTLDPGSARDDLLHTIACKAAIKGGQKNGPGELRVVAEAVMADRVRYCPHGRPVAIELTRKQLEKQFKRI